MAQKRLQGLFFNTVLFTNLSHEHLDFHGDMENYYRAKKLLFSEYLENDGAAVICLNNSGVEGEAEKQDWGRRNFQSFLPIFVVIQI